jgi:hypothetical protein
MPLSPKMPLPYRFVDGKFAWNSYLPHALYNFRLYHFLWFGYLGNIWRKPQVTDLLILQFYLSFYSIFLRPIHLPLFSNAFQHMSSRFPCGM